MTYTTVSEATDHETWLKARRELHEKGYIGASEVATVMGENPYQSALDWYLERTGERPRFEGNAHTRRGQVFEAAILEHANGEGILDDGRLWGALLAHDTHPVACTPDAYELGHNRRLVQIKDTRQTWDEEPPLMYQIQVQAELLVTGQPAGVLLAYMGNKELGHWVIEAHEGAQSAIVEAATDAIRRVRELDPPEIPATAEGLPHLKRAFPEDNGETVMLPEEAAEKDAALQEVKAQIRALEKEKKALEAYFWAQIKDARSGIIPGGARYNTTLVEVPARQQDGYSFRKMTRRAK